MDIVDVLSECPIDHDKMIGNPFRESYRMVLPSLPERTEDLSVLSVPTAKVVALVQLAQSVLLGTTENLVATVEDLAIDGKFDWETCNSAFSEHTVSVSKLGERDITRLIYVNRNLLQMAWRRSLARLQWHKIQSRSLITFTLARAYRVHLSHKSILQDENKRRLGCGARIVKGFRERGSASGLKH
jgi:hypothetical protein